MNHDTSRSMLKWMLALSTLGVAAFVLLPSSLALTTLVALVLAGAAVTANAAGLLQFPHDAARARAARYLGLLGLALCIASAYCFRPVDPGVVSPLRAWAIVTMLAGMLALGGTIWLSAPPLLADVTTRPLTPSRSRPQIAAAGAALMMLVGEMNAGLLGLAALEAVSPHVQFGLLVIGLVLVIDGLSGLPHPRLPDVPPLIVRVRRNRVEIALVLAILVLALAVRTWGLETTIRTSIDEIHWSDGVRRFWDAAPIDLLRPTSTYLPPAMLYSYWHAGGVEVFGRTLTGLRITNALLGTLTVLAAYGAGRALFDRPTALIAALVMATFPPHVHFSRVAMAQIGDALFGTMAVMFVARGLRFHRRLDWTLGGVSLGMTQFFYEGGRLLFPPVIAAWLLLVFVTRRDALRVHARGLLLAALALLAVVVPLYYSLAVNGDGIISRLSDSGVTSSYWATLFDGGLSPSEREHIVLRFAEPFLNYLHTPEVIPDYYGGDYALTLPPLVPLLLLGTGFVLWWALRGWVFAVVLLLWLAAVALGNGLMEDYTQYQRYVLSAPALVLLIAVGLRFGIELLLGGETSASGARIGGAVEPGAFASRWHMTPRKAVLALLAVIIAIGQVDYYFRQHLPRFNVQVREAKPYRDALDPMLRAVSLPANTHVFIISTPPPDGNVPRQFFGFFRDDLAEQVALNVVDAATVDAAFFNALPRDGHYAFFVAPGDERMMAMIRYHFPQVRPPEYSRYALPANKEHVLLFVPQAEF